MKVLNYLFRCILIICISLSLVGLMAINVASNTILSYDYIISKLEQNNYYEETYKLVYSNFEKYIYQSGLDENIIENICTPQQVKEDIDIVVSNIYNGDNKEISTNKIKKTLSNNIEQTGVKNKNNEEMLNEFIKCIVDEYSSTILHTNYEEQINNILSKVQRTIGVADIAVKLILAVSLVCLVGMNIKNIAKTLQDLSSASLATGILYLMLYSNINNNIAVNNIQVFNSCFSKVLVVILNDIFEKILYIGIGMMIIFVGLTIIAFVVALTKSKRKNDNL